MKTRGVRLYGKSDLRLEEFELPPIREDEILARVISDSICMSTYKCAIQGEDHKRVPKNVAQNPTLMGHEFAGIIVEVGKKWQKDFHPGQKFSIQPALNYKGSMDSPGYSFPYVGGDATYVILPHQVMELNCLLPFEGDSFYAASLSEPLSCVAGTFHTMYHSRRGVYTHEMGIRPGGNLAILAGVGPMGLAAIEYVLNCDRRPGRMIVTDIDPARLARAEKYLSPAYARERGVELRYLNTNSVADPEKELTDFTSGHGFDDMLVFAPIPPVIEMGDRLLGEDGCLSFFAGPSDKTLSAKVNFYNIHYLGTHVMGTTGGNTDDMREVLKMMDDGVIDPALLVTHVGGLDAAAEATLHLPEIPGGKKLIYTGVSMPLTALEDLPMLGRTDPFYAKLAELTAKTNGLWNPEAEKFLLDSLDHEEIK